MAVGVETETQLHPLTVCGILGYNTPRPPLRQAAGRYATYSLLRWYAEEDFIIIETLMILC